MIPTPEYAMIDATIVESDISTAPGRRKKPIVKSSHRPIARRPLPRKSDTSVVDVFG